MVESTNSTIKFITSTGPIEEEVTYKFMETVKEKKLFQTKIEAEEKAEDKSADEKEDSEEEKKEEPETKEKAKSESVDDLADLLEKKLKISEEELE